MKLSDLPQEQAKPHPLRLSDLNAGPRSFSDILGQGASALGSDIKSHIIDPLVNFVKTPADVYAGKYGPPGSPDMQSAARSEALGIAGLQLPIVRAGGGAAAGGVADAAKSVGDKVRSFAPSIDTIGHPTTVGPLGEMLRKNITTKLGQLNEGQTVQVERALKRLGIDPYTDKASDLASKVFKDHDTVALIKHLAGGEEWLQNHAGAYVATKLREATSGTGRFETYAHKAAAWLGENRHWLAQFPEVEKAAEKYIAGLHRTAVAKGAATIAALSALPRSLHGLVP